MTADETARTGADQRPAAGTVGEPRLRRIPPVSHLCLTTHGAYWKLSGTFVRLRSWMSAAGLDAVGPAMGVFYDDPDVTPPEACRFSICYPLDADAADRAGDALATGRQPLPPRPDTPAAVSTPTHPPADTLTVERTAETTVAVLEYAGPAADSPAVYDRLARWVEERDLTPAGPPREVYLAEPGTLGKGSMHAEVQQPVLVP